MDDILEKLKKFDITEITYERGGFRGKDKDGFSFRGEHELMVIHEAVKNDEAAKKIWKFQDGFPSLKSFKEYDWSGIRDSSQKAIAKMYLIAIEEDKEARELDSLLQEVKRRVLVAHL